MEQLQELLFELSSDERMDILLRLQSSKYKLAELSKLKEITNPEALRQLRRLIEVGLVEKDPDGLYGISRYGDLVLGQLSGIDFVARNRDYFSRYDTSFLPYEFINRFGELSNCIKNHEPFKIIEVTAKVLQEAEEFVWIISSQNLTLLAPIMMEKLKSSFDFRLIFPEGIFPPDDSALIPTTTNGMEKRVLPEVNVRIIVTDKWAGFGLPLMTSKSDYRSFMGDDTMFYKWCKDLFLHYWQESKPFISS